MKYFLIVLTIIVLNVSAHAQTAEDSVRAVITKMFTAMKAADGGLLKSCFSDSIVFQTIARTKDGSTVVKREDANEFANVVGGEKAGNLDEQISFDMIKIDGPLAIAWTPYKFYYQGKFSHCGVNSFQLVRFNGVWRIQYIIDTRRKTGCE